MDRIIYYIWAGQEYKIADFPVAFPMNAVIIVLNEKEKGDDLLCNSSRDCGLIVRLFLLTLFLTVLCRYDTANATESNWLAGTWHSKIYPDFDHHLRIGLRIETIDSETCIPIEGLHVRLWGKNFEERIGMPPGQYGEPPEPQEKEFRLEAVTDNDEVVVFALGWQKVYPNSSKTS